MEYNTERNKLVIPEYGRNVQKMIEYAQSIEDRDERTKTAKAIVQIMGQLNPQFKDAADYSNTLWDHLFIISNFSLDVDSPYPMPEKEALQHKPEKVPYPQHNIRYKHYGKTTEFIIEDIVKREDGPEKDIMIKMLCNFMKMAYTNWNRDSVNDEQIFNNVIDMSKGKIKIPEGLVLNAVAEPVQRNHKSNHKKKKRSRSNGSRGRK
ncbi:MAG: DUF4290 domain-containing protein [Bacteroidia bacterium]|nr:DUF4290 domain-containing protein [Bacteroidia bacterium]